MSHRGRPKGKVVEDQKMGLVAGRLSELLGQPVQIAEDCMVRKLKKQWRNSSQEKS
jgi:3-phosphoglycerate kinase